MVGGVGGGIERASAELRRLIRLVERRLPATRVVWFRPIELCPAQPEPVELGGRAWQAGARLERLAAVLRHELDGRAAMKLLDPRLMFAAVASAPATPAAGASAGAAAVGGAHLGAHLMLDLVNVVLNALLFDLGSSALAGAPEGRRLWWWSRKEDEEEDDDDDEEEEEEEDDDDGDDYEGEGGAHEESDGAGAARAAESRAQRRRHQPPIPAYRSRAARRPGRYGLLSSTNPARFKPAWRFGKSWSSGPGKTPELGMWLRRRHMLGWQGVWNEDPQPIYDDGSKPLSWKEQKRIALRKKPDPEDLIVEKKEPLFKTILDDPWG